MSNFYNDEPRDTPGTRQIITDLSEGQEARAWLTTDDNDSPKRTIWTIAGDAVVWVSSAGLLHQLVMGISRLVTWYGAAQTPAIVLLLFFTAIAAYLAYRLYYSSATEFYFRAFLFIFGLVIVSL